MKDCHIEDIVLLPDNMSDLELRKQDLSPEFEEACADESAPSLGEMLERPRPRNQRRSLPAVDKKLERKRVVVRHRVCVAYRIDVKTKKSRAVLLRAASGFRLPASFQITFITLLFFKKRFKFNDIYIIEFKPFFEKK